MSFVVYQNSDMAIANKPHNMPTVPLKSQAMEGTLLGAVASECPQVLNVLGKNSWEYGTMHRLDTATAGLVVFAKNQKFYDYLMDIQSRDLFVKTYLATTVSDDRLMTKDSPILIPGNSLSETNSEDSTLEVSSFFRSFGPGAKQVRPTVDIKRADSKVIYTTIIRKAEANDSSKANDKTECFECTITRGFRHQIRAHLAWIGHPIVGDSLYGPQTDAQCTDNQTEADKVLHLTCIRVEFPLWGSRAFRFSL